LLLHGWGKVVFGLVLLCAIAPALALCAVSFLPLSLVVEFASRVQIREHGVIAGARYIRWERIYCYALEEV
jgi:hypothetical protein